MTATIVDTGAVVEAMTLIEASDWKRRVGHAANELRVLLWEGYQRQAWIPLGYATWTECVKAIAQEFGYSENYVWLLHAANKTESLLDHGQVGQIPERHLRPIASLPAEQQPVVWQRAAQCGQSWRNIGQNSAPASAANTEPAQRGEILRLARLTEEN